MAEGADVAWLEGLSPWPDRRLRARAHAGASRGARPPRGRSPRGARRRHERQVDDDADGRGAAPRRREACRCVPVAPRSVVGGADPRCRRGGRPFRGARRGAAGRRTGRRDPVRGADRGGVRRVSCGQGRRRGGRGRARRPARCDERPRPDAGRRPHERLARAHRRARNDARGDRGGEARSRPCGLHGRARRARMGGGCPDRRRRPRRHRRGRLGDARDRGGGGLPRREGRRIGARRGRAPRPARAASRRGPGRRAQSRGRALAGRAAAGRRSTRWWHRSSGTRMSR